MWLAKSDFNREQQPSMSNLQQFNTNWQRLAGDGLAGDGLDGD